MAETLSPTENSTKKSDNTKTQPNTSISQKQNNLTIVVMLWMVDAPSRYLLTIVSRDSFSHQTWARFQPGGA